MACFEFSKKAKVKELGEVDGRNMIRDQEVCTLDGTVDRHGHCAIRGQTRGWAAGILILVNQVLVTLAFFEVEVNLKLFLTRVLHKDKVAAANIVSIWNGTVYIFSIAGMFLSDSYRRRYKTCGIFQIIFVIGLVSLSLSSHLFLVKPTGCGDKQSPCGSHSLFQMGIFYLSIYLIALGYGGYQPNIAKFGADQFDEEDTQEGHSKVAFFRYFYLALNLGSLFSNTILGYFENEGVWTLGFWSSAGSAFVALVLFLAGTPRYRHSRQRGNPFSRFCQVVVAATKKWRVEMPPGGEGLYEVDGEEGAIDERRKILHTQDFKFLDRAAFIRLKDIELQSQGLQSPWRLCTITQVEEVKCILRLVPIWLCTILYSIVFTQMASLFVEQGAAMKTTISNFRIPPASMFTFSILSAATFIFIYKRVLDHLVDRLRKTNHKGLTELQRMGVGIVVAIMALVSAGFLELYRLKYAKLDCTHCKAVSSSSSIFWQIPQYVFMGASQVFMYVTQMEFFNGQVPDELKSFGSVLWLTSISLGNYMSILLVTMVMKFSTKDLMAGWIPENLNKGHLDRYYFLLAVITTVDLVVYVACAKRYKCVKCGDMDNDGDDEEHNISV